MADPIYPEFTADPSDLEEIGFDYLRGVLPGWEPTGDGDGITQAVQTHSRIAAEVIGVAADVPSEALLPYLGESVFRIPRLAAAAATVQATITMRDPAGYTIDAGTEFLVRTTGDDGVVFATVAPVTVPVGVLATEPGEVTLRAAVGYEGTIGNDLDSAYDVVPIRSDLGFIETIELAGTSTGGVDAETAEQYAPRMLDELELQSPAPIMARDAEILVRRVPGIVRTLAINLYLVREEIIEITYAGAGTGTLTDSASARSVSLTSGATAASIETAFEALSPASGGRYQATATGGPLGTAPVVVALRGRASYGPWQLATTGPTVSYRHTQAGGDRTPVPLALAVAAADIDGEPVGTTKQQEGLALLESMREEGWLFSVIDFTYTGIDVAYEATADEDADPVVVNAAALAALTSFLSPATFGLRPEGEEPTFEHDDTIRYLDVAYVLRSTPGMRRLDRLQIGLEGRALGTADVPLAGPAPLPRPGAGITGTVREG